MRNQQEIIKMVEQGKFDELSVEEQIWYDEYEQNLIDNESSEDVEENLASAD